MKLHQKHQCDIGNKQYRTEFDFLIRPILVTIATEIINPKGKAVINISYTCGPNLLLMYGITMLETVPLMLIVYYCNAMYIWQ